MTDNGFKDYSQRPPSFLKRAQGMNGGQKLFIMFCVVGGVCVFYFVMIEFVISSLHAVGLTFFERQSVAMLLALQTLVTAVVTPIMTMLITKD